MELNQIVYYFLVLIQFEFIATAEWKCTDDVCNEYLLIPTNACPSLSDDCKNSSKSIVIPSLSICNCCEYCITFQEEGDDCTVGYPGLSFPSEMCGPNLQCHPTKKICVKMVNPSGFDTDFFPGYTCDENDNCQCAVIVRDKVRTIFGEFKKTKETENEIQCECSIAAYKAKTQINKQFPFDDTYMATSRCLTNGQFDPLQCIDNTCRCVSKETGEWNQTIPIVSPIFTLDVDNPPCFNSSIHKPGQYFTECEQERNELVEERLSAQEGGYNVIYGKKVNCNPDGTYADVNA